MLENILIMLASSCDSEKINSKTLAPILLLVVLTSFTIHKTLFFFVFKPLYRLKEKKNNKKSHYTLPFSASSSSARARLCLKFNSLQENIEYPNSSQKVWDSPLNLLCNFDRFVNHFITFIQSRLKILSTHCVCFIF